MKNFTPFHAIACDFVRSGLSGFDGQDGLDDVRTMRLSSTQPDDFAVAVCGVHEEGTRHGWFRETILWARFVSKHPVRWIRFLWRKEFLGCDDLLLKKKCVRCLFGLRIWLVVLAVYVGISLWILWFYFRLAIR